MLNLTPSKVSLSQSMRTVVLLLFSAFLLMPVSAEADKNADNRVIRQLEQIEKLQASYKEKLQVADSLIVVGDTLLARTTEEIFQATIKMKQQAKAYSDQKRNMEKTMSELPRKDANELRTSIREMDIEYRKALQEYDEFMRHVIRESENGLSSYDKGQGFRKEAEKGLKEVERRLAEIKNSLDSSSDEDVNVTMK